jgi:hypothetical protein
VGSGRKGEGRLQDEEVDQHVRRDREEDGPLDRKDTVAFSLEVEEVFFRDFRGGGRALVQVEQGPFRRTLFRRRLFALLAFLAREDFKHAVFRPNWCSAHLNAPATPAISKTAVYLGLFVAFPASGSTFHPKSDKNIRRSGTWMRGRGPFFVRPDRR